MDLSYKSVGFQLEELKARDDGWSFSGYASTFGNVDLGGDVVLKGAFRQSLKDRRPKLLWQHDIGEPIGTVSSLKEDDRGLFGEFKISKTTRGHDAYQLLKDGAVDSMSIGYIPSEVEFDDKAEVRKLKAVDLLEISVVSMPMNEEALITAVKAALRLPLAKHIDRLLDDVRIVTTRCQDVARLRAGEQRPPGESVDRIRTELPTELKALAAEVEALLSAVPEAEPPAERLGGSTTSLRLALVRKRLERRGILEHAS